MRPNVARRSKTPTNPDPIPQIASKLSKAVSITIDGETFTEKELIEHTAYQLASSHLSIEQLTELLAAGGAGGG